MNALNSRNFARATRVSVSKNPASLLASVCLGIGLLAGTQAASAAGNDGMGVYVQGGHNFAHGTDTDNLFVGVMVPWGAPRPSFLGTSFSSYFDGYIGQWRGPDANNNTKTYTNLAASVVGRFRFSEGRSPWFTEASIGLSYLDDIYQKPGGRVYSTRLNFTERFGVGVSFGARDEHEVSLNYQHYSNAGIKKPNPGEDFVQLRYAYRF